MLDALTYWLNEMYARHEITRSEFPYTSMDEDGWWHACQNYPHFHPDGIWRIHGNSKRLGTRNHEPYDWAKSRHHWVRQFMPSISWTLVSIL